jgi:hypothetical protein
VGIEGSADYIGDTFVVAGGGADIWGAADAFRFVFQPLNGDGEIVAQVSGIENVNAWTKAGVMIRESMQPNSRHASLFASPGKGLAFQRRVATGGASVNTGVSGVAPVWLKLTRAGDLVSAYRSADGVAWTPVGTETIPMDRLVFVGLAV